MCVAGGGLGKRKKDVGTSLASLKKNIGGYLVLSVNCLNSQVTCMYCLSRMYRLILGIWNMILFNNPEEYFYEGRNEIGN